MKIIDAHVHYSDLFSFHECAKSMSKVDYSREGFINESKENNIVRSVCMGLGETTPGKFPDESVKTPMLANLTDKLPEGMAVCLGINPHTLNEHTLGEIEELIKAGGSKVGGDIVGMKVYAGYYHYYVTDPIYDPIYKLAEKYDITIAVHTGETFSERGLLKYSHPLKLDEVAVAHPDLRILACHMGVPWIFDAAELAIKNKNFYVDISGILVGGKQFLDDKTTNQLFLDRYRQALMFLDNYEKVLYGTDWPLVPMSAYMNFCKHIVPEEEYGKVFYENAKRVYKL